MCQSKRLPFGVSFDDYLASELIVLSYLPNNDTLKRFLNRIFIWILLTNLFVYNIRHIIFLLIDESNLLNFYLGDPDYGLGIARNAMNFVYLDWNLIGWIIGVYIKYTQKITKRQKWTCLAKLFTNGHFHGTKAHASLIKWFLKLTTFQRFSAVTIASSAFIPLILIIPPQFKINAIIAAIHQGFVAFTTSAYLCNSAPLFGLTIYMYAKFFQNQAHFLRSQKSGHIFAGAYYAQFVAKIHKQMFESYLFYQPINTFAFIGTYMAQILILFFVFFTDMDWRVKIVFCSFFFLNQNSGQTFHFLVSSLAFKRVN